MMNKTKIDAYSLVDQEQSSKLMRRILKKINF